MQDAERLRFGKLYFHGVMTRRVRPSGSHRVMKVDIKPMTVSQPSWVWLSIPLLGFGSLFGNGGSSSSIPGFTVRFPPVTYSVPTCHGRPLKKSAG